MKTFLKYLLYGLALTPLIMARGLFFPYISGKNIYIRSLLTAFFVCYAIWISISDSAKRECVAKLKGFWGNWTGRFFAGFYLVVLLSTIFAQNAYRAFFGDVERAEGLVGLLYFGGFALASYLIFERKDWIRFLQISMGVGIILFVDALSAFAKGVVRPSSFLGNPIYLAVYFLFTLFASGIMYLEAQSSQYKKTWYSISIGMALISVAGVFITETRGVMVGIAAGLLLAIIYVFAKAKEVKVFGKDVQKIALGILAVMVLGGGLFFATRSAPVWQHIPGLDRLSQFTSGDSSTQTRLISAGVSMHAVNPALNGIGKFLIGWGPENFSVAYNTYYNPEYFRYEQQWFDRAHDKLMDVLVMHGILGLVAYLGLWISAFWLLFKGKFSWEKLMFLFFGVGYFVQNLFVFDAVGTYIPLYGFFAFLMYSYGEKEGSTSDSKKIDGASYGTWGVIALAAFYTVGLIWWTIIPFSQISRYLDTVKAGQISDLKAFEKAFMPYTFVQELIRTHFVNSVKDAYQGEKYDSLMQLAVGKAEELVAREPFNPRYLMQVAQAYDKWGTVHPEMFARGEEAYRKGLTLAPRRQDILYALGYNLAYQKKIDESLVVLKEAVDLDPQVSDAHVYLGSAYANAGKIPEALKELSAAYAIDPQKYENNESYLQAAVFVYRRLKDARDTVRMQEALRIIPDKYESSL